MTMVYHGIPWSYNHGQPYFVKWPPMVDHSLINTMANHGPGPWLTMGKEQKNSYIRFWALNWPWSTSCSFGLSLIRHRSLWLYVCQYWWTYISIGIACHEIIATHILNWVLLFFCSLPMVTQWLTMVLDHGLPFSKTRLTMVVWPWNTMVIWPSFSLCYYLAQINQQACWLSWV